jgi:DNA topoisomerase-1
MTAAAADKLIDQKINGADALGKDPVTGLPVYALNGRYGPYVQLGDVDGDEAKPKRVSIPANIPLETISLAQALDLLVLPKTLGLHPGSGKEIKAGLGRFGPFIVCDGDYRSIPKAESIFTITLERALEMLAQPKKGRGRATPVKELGPHPVTSDPINLMNGPYGVYLKCGKVNSSLPEGLSAADVNLEKALEILADKMGTGAKGKANGGAKLKTKEIKARKGGDKTVPKPSQKRLATKTSKLVEMMPQTTPPKASVKSQLKTQLKAKPKTKFKDKIKTKLLKKTPEKRP